MTAASWRRWLRLARLAAAGLLAAASLAAAQPRPSPSASVTGVVVDSTDAVLPYAQVQIVSASGETIGTTTTDAAGAFAFERLPPGRYQIRASLDGFQPRAQTVTLGRRALKPLRIALALAEVHQEVTVTGGATQVSTAAAANADAVSVSANALESLPIFDDDAVAAISKFLDSGSLGTGGVTILVNGMEVNSLNVSTSAIQQIKINEDPYSAAFSRPGRGRINILTKPGSREYHGDATVIARDSSLNARNAFAPEKPPEQRRIVDAFLGGPLGRGATSFMASLKDDTEDRQAIVFALGPDGDIRDAVSRPFRHLLATVGVTRQHGGSTMSIRPSYEEETDESRGVGGTTLGSAGTTYYHQEIDLTYNQQTVIRPTLLNQFQLLVGHEDEPTTSVSPLPGIVVDGAFTGGGAQVDLHRTELHFQLAENLALTRGRHLLQVGFQAPDWSRRGFDDRAVSAARTTSPISVLTQAGRPYAYVQQSGNGRVVWLEKVLGFYANDDWQVSPDATLSLGLRYDWSNYFRDHDTLAPRFSFSIKPGGSESTVLRGGAGSSTTRSVRFPSSTCSSTAPAGCSASSITNPPYPDPFQSGSAAAEPPSTAQFAPGIEVPWILQFSGGVERQLSKAMTLSVMYYGHTATLLRSRDVNAPPPPDYAARPDPAFGVIRQIDSAARQRGDSLQVTARGRVAKWFSGQAQYIIGRVSNDSGGVNWYPANDYDLASEWARAGFDRRQRLLFVGSLTPAPRLTVGASLTLGSGFPYSETLGGDPYNDGRGGARPPGVGRNTLEGAGSAELALRVAKDFVFGQGLSARTVTVGLDAFNVVNRVNYTAYVGTVSSPLFGQPVAAGRRGSCSSRRESSFEERRRLR